MTFTDTQLEILKEAEPHFRTAKSGFVRYASRDLSNKVADTYFQATGQIIPKNWSCGICVLNLYRKVGWFYFKDLEELEKNKVSNEPEPNALEPTESNPPEKPVANKNKKKDGSKSK